MLSLILYGRNDSHGYNLHKRAAISLNAMAEVLTSPDDEILFVDYNTPDELPTFLETIADTLTETARQRIRIIRVRQDYHKQFAGRTTLVALESQSRNIAVRRANPNNRWILSTNTDMIFVPSQKDDSLSSIVGRLPDGFYHLPRYELPEGFWERANRLDPVGMIEAMRAYGRRFHLNEVVYGGFDNLYEAPGDFQLFLREDLFRIRGFDETMIKGWHVDTNTARRMKLLRGKVDTAFPMLAGYHCGHTRQATSLHGARRTENSLDTYVRNVVSPDWTTSDDWGAPDQDFEEVRLTQSREQSYFDALRRAVVTDGPDYTEASYNESTYCEQGFHADHVLPHLADVLLNLPAGLKIFTIGTDPEFIEGVRRLVVPSPVNAQLILWNEQASPGPVPGLSGLSLAEGLQQADVFLLQYPNARTVALADRAELEWSTQHALERIVEVERARPKVDRRRVIVVNGLHTRLQDLIWSSLDAAAAPYSARLRQGFVFDSVWHSFPSTDARGVDIGVYEALGRMRGFSAEELAQFAGIFRAPAGEAPQGWERLANELVAIAARPEFLVARLQVDPKTVEPVVNEARRHIERMTARCTAMPRQLPPRAEAPNRIASAADWEDPDWTQLAARYFGERAYAERTRSRWLWERNSLMHQLRRRLPPSERPWILVVGDGPDFFAAMASHQGYRVAYASMADILSGAPTPTWADAFRMDNIVLSGARTPLHALGEDIRFDGVIGLGCSLFNDGAVPLERLLSILGRRIKPGAFIGGCALVHLNNRTGGGALAHGEFATAFEPRGLLARLSLEPTADVDARIPLDAAVRFAFEDKEGDVTPGLSFGFDAGALLTIGMLWSRTPGGAAGANAVAPVHLPPVAADRPPATPAVAQTSQPAHDPKFSPERTRSTLAETAAEMKSRVLLYPAIFRRTARKLLPVIVANGRLERSAEALRIEADGDGRVRFGAPLALGEESACRLTVGIAPAGAPMKVVLLSADGRMLPGRVTGRGEETDIEFAGEGAGGDAFVVFEIDAPEIRLTAASAVSRQLDTAVS